MKTLRDRLPALFFLALLLAPGIWHGWLQVRQQQVWHRMEEALENEALQTIEINSSQVQWARPGKEIRLHGKLFDVKTVQYLPENKILLTGLFDEEETALREQFERTQNGPQAARTLRFFAFLFFNKIEQCIPPPPDNMQRLKEQMLPPDCRFTVREIPTPPPRPHC